MAADGVDFIDIDDAGGVFLPLDKKVPDPGGADADEHFHKIRAADAEKWDPRLTGNGPGQQGLPGPGGTDQQDALGNAAAQAGEFLGVS